jgi:hypothetical protein
MDRGFKNWLRSGSHWPVVVAGFSLLVLLSATGLVVASPSWSHRIVSSVATASYKVIQVAYDPGAATAIGSVDGDYVQGTGQSCSRPDSPVRQQARINTELLFARHIAEAMPSTVPASTSSEREVER